MAQSLKITPIFGPQVSDDATVVLPLLPTGITPNLDAAIIRYRRGFFSNDGGGDGVAVAVKFLIAHADGRNADTYDPGIEGDAYWIAGGETLS